MRLAFLGRWLARSGGRAWNSSAGQRTAEPGDAGSQFDSGCHLPGGNGADHAPTAEWYLKAARQGDGVAQFNLGLMYGQGKGVLRDEAAAVMWLRKAAELGNAGAQYHMGVRLHRASKGGQPLGASESRVEAFKWLQLAVARAYPGAASALEFVTLGMRREEVDEGSRRALTFAIGGAKS